GRRRRAQSDPRRDARPHARVVPRSARQRRAAGGAEGARPPLRRAPAAAAHGLKELPAGRRPEQARVHAAAALKSAVGRDDREMQKGSGAVAPLPFASWLLPPVTEAAPGA